MWNGVTDLAVPTFGPVGTSKSIDAGTEVLAPAPGVARPLCRFDWSRDGSPSRAAHFSGRREDASVTGYSGGARWMGIVSRRDTDPTPAVAQMRAPDWREQSATQDALSAIRRVLESRQRSARRRSRKSNRKGERARAEVALLGPALHDLEQTSPRVTTVVHEQFLHGTPVPVQWRVG